MGGLRTPARNAPVARAITADLRSPQRSGSGGPPPPGTVPPAHPIVGTITVTNFKTNETYRPHEDARGYFTVVVPVGTYSVMAESRGGVAAAMTGTVTVTPNRTVNAYLGIHMP